MCNNLIDEINIACNKTEKAELLTFNPLVLAYIGDAVFELYVRTLVINKNHNSTVSSLHKMSIDYVKAHSQSEFVHKIEPILTDEEEKIVKRGRNAKSSTIPKNADVIDYRNATGLEALIGYLYLKGDIQRLNQIISYII